MSTKFRATSLYNFTSRRKIKKTWHPTLKFWPQLHNSLFSQLSNTHRHTEHTHIYLWKTEMFNLHAHVHNEFTVIIHAKLRFFLSGHSFPPTFSINTPSLPRLLLLYIVAYLSPHLLFLFFAVDVSLSFTLHSLFPAFIVPFIFVSTSDTNDCTCTHTSMQTHG